jgi:hypothetical protein
MQVVDAAKYRVSSGRARPARAALEIYRVMAYSVTAT